MWNTHADQRRQRYLTLHTHFALNLNAPSRWALSVSGRKRTSEGVFILPSSFMVLWIPPHVLNDYGCFGACCVCPSDLTLTRLEPSSARTRPARTGLAELSNSFSFPVNCESTRFVQETQNQNKRLDRLRSSARVSSVRVNLWAAFAWKMSKFWCSCWSWAH